MMQFFENTMKILSESLQSIDEGVFNKLVEDSTKVLERGNQIVVTGLGKNVPICDKFVGTMLSMGKRAFFLHTNTAVHGDLGAVHDGDLVIILTKSGETTESIYLAQQLKKRDVELWLLTFCKESTLSKQVSNSLVMDLSHEGDRWNIMPNNSTTLNLIVLQGLAMSIAEKMNVKLEDFKRNHPGGYIGESLRKEQA